MTGSIISLIIVKRKSDIMTAIVKPKNKLSAVPEPFEDWDLCTIIHLLLQKKSNQPSSFLFSTMSDNWWDVWHMGQSSGVSIFCKDVKE